MAPEKRTIIENSQPRLHEPYGALLAAVLQDATVRCLRMKGVQVEIREAVSTCVNRYLNDSPLKEVVQSLDCQFEPLIPSSSPDGDADLLRLPTMGALLGEDGVKMSQQKRNYPSPEEVLQEFSPEQLRYYLLRSPAAEGKHVMFSLDDIDLVRRKLINPLFNLMRFYSSYRQQSPDLDVDPTQLLHAKSLSFPDEWILIRLSELLENLTSHFKSCSTSQAAQVVEEFIQDLSGWYLRVSRARFAPTHDLEDREKAFRVLHKCLFLVCKAIAPLAPGSSISLINELQDNRMTEPWPTSAPREDHFVTEEMKRIRQIIQLGLSLRSQHGIKLRQPLPAIYVKSDPFRSAKAAECVQLIQDQLNVKSVVMINEEKAPHETLISCSEEGTQVFLDIAIDDELQKEGVMRDMIRIVQNLRKKADYEVSDRISLAIIGADEVIRSYADRIQDQTKADDISRIELEKPEQSQRKSLLGKNILFQIKRSTDSD